MPQYTAILAVSSAAYAGGSVWALLSGAAILSLLDIAPTGVMTRVLGTDDDDVVRQCLRLIAINAFWASSTAYVLGVVVRQASG